MPNTDFEFNVFWSYKQNLEYDKAENIKDFFRRVYNFLDNVKSKYVGKRILIVAHGGISIPVKCYFEKYQINIFKELKKLQKIQNKKRL